MDQASKAPRNFNPRAFTFEDLKNNKSLISSKLEIYCEDHPIHLPTKVKKILVRVKFNEDRIKGYSFVKESK